MISVLVELTTTLALTLLIRASRTLRTVVFAARRWDGFGMKRIRNDAAYHHLVTLRGLPLDLFNKIMRIVDWPRALTDEPRRHHGYQQRPRTATRKERRQHLVTQKEVRKGVITNYGADMPRGLIALRRTPAIGGRTRIIAAQRLGDLSLLGTGDLPHIPTPGSYIAGGGLAGPSGAVKTGHTYLLYRPPILG